MEEKITGVKTAKDGSDITAIKTAIEALSTELSKIGEAMQKANADAGATQNPTPEQQGEEIKDAEVKEENK